MLTGGAAERPYASDAAVASRLSQRVSVRWCAPAATRATQSPMISAGFIDFTVLNRTDGAGPEASRGNIVAAPAPPDAFDASAEPRNLDDLDGRERILRVRTRLRALWGDFPWWFESTRAHWRRNGGAVLKPSRSCRPSSRTAITKAFPCFPRIPRPSAPEARMPVRERKQGWEGSSVGRRWRRLTVGAREAQGLAARSEPGGDRRPDASRADDRGGHGRDIVGVGH